MHYHTSMRKGPTSFRLSDEALSLLALISKELGISQASAVEQALRLLARKLNIKKHEGKS
jgi:hypothetical protein